MNENIAESNWSRESRYVNRVLSVMSGIELLALISSKPALFTKSERGRGHHIFKVSLGYTEEGDIFDEKGILSKEDTPASLEMLAQVLPPLGAADAQGLTTGLGHIYAAFGTIEHHTDDTNRDVTTYSLIGEALMIVDGYEVVISPGDRTRFFNNMGSKPGHGGFISPCTPRVSLSLLGPQIPRDI